MIQINAVLPRLDLTLEFAGWRLHELSCCLCALASCLARCPCHLSPLPQPCTAWLSPAVPASRALQVVLSCVLWEMAEDAALHLTALFIFQSQSKDLNREIGVIGRSRKTQCLRVSFKVGISSYSCYQSSGNLRLPLFQRRNCRLSSSWKECEWPVKSKDFLRAP